MAILEVKDLHKTYLDGISSEALNGINFTLEKKEFIAIIGRSGCGKSTLLNCVATLDKATSGEIKFVDEIVSSFNEEDAADFRRSNLGIVSKESSLIAEMTVEENIMLPLILDEANRKVIHKRLEKIAGFLNIASILKKRTTEINALEAKKVELARAMIHDPDILILDEPCANLNSDDSRDFLRQLISVNKSMKVSTILGTSSPFSACYSQKTLFMKDGRLTSTVINEGDGAEYYKKLMQIYALLEGGEFNGIKEPDFE